MTRQKQKQDEVNAVKGLRDVLPTFPQNARIEACDDPLDVVVILPDGSSIGVEVTEFVRDKSKRGSRLDAHQNLTRKIARAAELDYAARGQFPVYSAISFSKDMSCSATDIRAYAEQIAQRVADIAHDVTMPLQIESGLPSGVEKIIVYPGRMPLPQFAVTYSDNWDYLTEEHIEEILAEKEPKLPAYHAKCERVWLLIYVPGTRMSGWVEPPPGMSLRCQKTSFDRVFFL